MSWETYSRPTAPHVRNGLFIVIRKGGQIALFREVVLMLTGKAPDEFLVDLLFDPDEPAVAVRANPSGRFVARKAGWTWIIGAADLFEAYGVSLYAATRYHAEQFEQGLWGCRMKDGQRTGRARRVTTPPRPEKADGAPEED